MAFWSPAKSAKPRASPAQPSARYRDVPGRVDAGFNEKKLQALQSDRWVNARYKKDEQFRRLKAAQLAKLLAEGGLDLLVLDIRDEDCYEEFHVRTALNYPARLFTRAHHPFSAQLLAYANGEPEGKLVVLYDEDERQAAPTATLLFEKGFDNVFIVTGGLREMARAKPRALEGEQLPPGPSCCLPSPERDKRGWRRSKATAQVTPEQRPAPPAAEDQPQEPRERPLTCKPGQVSVREISAAASQAARPVTAAARGAGAGILARQQPTRGLLGPLRAPGAGGPARRPVAPFMCAGPGDNSPVSQENQAGNQGPERQRSLTAKGTPRRPSPKP